MQTYKLNKYSFLLFSLFITPLFGLFTYNSGYGYDALEYFITARSLNEGYQMYDFIPSKSWLWYVFVQWGINFFGGSFNHVTVTALITVLFVGCGWSVYWVSKRLTGSVFQATLAGALTMICSFFMEMNFLEPEAPIVILAAWALYFLVRRDFSSWLWGGILLGIAMLMKSVAMFYVAAAGVYLIIEWLIFKSTDFKKFFYKGFALGLGFAIPLGLSMVYFNYTGKLEEHIYWSYIYPFGSYPPHTLFLKKLIIKTFWFIALFLVSVALSFKSSPAKFWKNSTFLLSILFGVFSLLALLKSQASHYLYTAAPFFAIAIVMVFESYSTKLMSKKFLILLGTMVLMVGGVTFATRPDAVRRLFEVQSYEGDKYVYQTINKHLSKGDKALFIDFGTYYYFQTHRYPNVPFINTEMQTSDYISRNVDTYEMALQDPALKMVIFGNRPAVIDDSTMAESPTNKVALDKLRLELENSFVTEYDSLLNLTLWLRKN